MRFSLSWLLTAARVLSVVLPLCLLSGCGKAPEAPIHAEASASVENQRADVLPPEPTIRLNWMGHWMHEDLRESLVRKMAEEFSFEHPNIEVNLRFPQEVLGRRSKPAVARYIADMIRFGRYDWDIIWLDDHIYSLTAQELADREWGKKYLVDFEKVPGFVESQKDFIISDPVYRRQTGGVLVGPYVEGYLYALWFNRDVARRLGLDIKERGMTYADLLGYVQRVHEYNQTAKKPVAAFYESKDWVTMEILFQNLVKSAVPDFRESIAPEFTLAKGQAMLRGLEAFEELGQYDPLIPSHDQNIWFETRQLVLNDEALFYCNGTWMYSHWRGLDKRKLAKMVPAELPTFDRVDHGLGGYIPTWAVMKESPNRDAAVDFLMSWCSPEVADKWVRYTKNPTGIRGNLDQATLGTDVCERYLADMVAQYESRTQYSAGVGYLLGAENSHLLAEVKHQLKMLLTGKRTADHVWADIVARCE